MVSCQIENIDRNYFKANRNSEVEKYNKLKFH